MLNIFNQFLFLVTLWLCLMLIGNNLTIVYFFIGIIASLTIAVFSYRIRLIDANSKFLYLSFGFYRHFFILYFKNFFRAIFLIIELAINRRTLNPKLHFLDIKRDHNFSEELLIASINLSAGLLVIQVNEENIVIHSIDEEFFYRVNFNKIYKNLANVNDDEIV